MSREGVVAALLGEYGSTFADELGIPVARDQPAAWFRLLTAALLLSANIDARLGLRTARALTGAGLTTAAKMAEASDRERWKVLAEARYLRKDRAARMLGETARLCLERYGGDLRRLRKEADRDPGRERELLREFKGIGPVGADIFLREAQVAWDELVPWVDERARHAAARLKLPSRPEELAGLVPRRDVARLVAALVRCDLDDGYDSVRSSA